MGIYNPSDQPRLCQSKKHIDCDDNSFNGLAQGFPGFTRNWKTNVAIEVAEIENWQIQVLAVEYNQSLTLEL